MQDPQNQKIRTHIHTYTHLSIFAVRAVPAVFSRDCLGVGVCLGMHAASLLLVVRASICFAAVRATCCCLVPPNTSALSMVELQLLVLVLLLFVWLLPV